MPSLADLADDDNDFHERQGELESATLLVKENGVAYEESFQLMKKDILQEVTVEIERRVAATKYDVIQLLEALNERVSNLESQRSPFTPVPEKTSSLELERSCSAAFEPKTSNGVLLAPSFGNISSSVSFTAQFLVTEANKVTAVEPSSWEGVVIAFHPGVGGLKLADSVSLVLAALSNIVLQFLCMLIVLQLFLAPELPDLEEVRTWRNTYAHDYKQLIEVSFSSLASAVCSGDNSLIVSRGQQEVYNLIENFNMAFSHAWLLDVPVGRLLCILMIVCWCQCVLGEFPRIISFAWAYTNILGRRTKIAFYEGENLAFELMQVGMYRYVALMVLLCVRMVIAGALLLSGSVWLANTVETRELLLNSAALSVILEIDERLYENLVTPQAKIMVRHLRPLTGPGNVFRILNPSLALVLTTAWVFFMRIWTIEKVSEDMDKIKEAMCGSNVDFVAGQGAFDLAYVLATKPFQAGVHSLMTDNIGEYVATGKSLAMAKPPTLDVFRRDITASHFERMQWFSAMLMNNQCVDMFPLSPQLQSMPISPMFVITPLTYQAQFSGNFTDCAQLAHRCDDIKLQLLRLACPVTCGCHSPLSGLWLNGPTLGCPASTCQKDDAYLQALSHPCADMSIADLNATPGWHKFWKGWLTHLTGLKKNQGDKVHADTFKVKGCSAFNTSKRSRDKFHMLFCSPTGVHSSIQMFCPVSCECDSKTTGCPSTCG